jgi:hypothetical protein
MTWLSLGLALVALGSALAASWSWYQSTNVKLPFDIIIDHVSASMHAWDLTKSLKETARLNRIAAIWTALASVAGSLSAVAGSLPQSN